MSTGTIVAIVVVALILIALLAFALPRMRRGAQAKARARELAQRREHVAGEHRAVAGEREREAEVAEQKAQMAQTDAERQRAEAQLHEQQADMHERGMADDQLVDEHEREHFAPAMGADADRDGVDDRDQAGSRAAGGGPRVRPTGDQDRTDYEQGRIDERQAEEGGGRFRRQPDEAPADAPSETRRP
jgi:FtsZ-interacting cell division protein ZipA